MIICWPRLGRRAHHAHHHAHRGWQHVHHARHKAKAVAWTCITVGAMGAAGSAGAVIASPWWTGNAGIGAAGGGQATEIMQVPEPSSALLLLTAVMFTILIAACRSPTYGAVLGGRPEVQAQDDQAGEHDERPDDELAARLP